MVNMRLKLYLVITFLFVCTFTFHTNFRNTYTFIEQFQKILPDNTMQITHSIHTHANSNEVMHAYYSYPQFLPTMKHSEKLNNFYLKKLSQDYNSINILRETAINSPLSGNHVYAYDHTFEITYHSANLISILENTYEYAGGTHPDNYLEANTFSLQTGEVLPLGDLFHNSKPETEKRIKNYIIEEINLNPEDYYPDTPETISGLSLDSFHYYLKNGALIIFFNPYEIAPYPRGVVEFTFPIITSTPDYFSSN